MQKILRSSRFDSSQNAHGGHRRTAQIEELIEQFGLDICDLEAVSTNHLDRYLGGLTFLTKYKFKIYPSYKILSLCGKQYKTLENYLYKNKHTKLLLWEDTNNYVAPYVAKDAGFNVVAVPHNLESLVVEQLDSYTHRSLPESLANEVKHLAKADAVFCISREEQWLLKLYGIDAEYLPYYPPQAILSTLLELRKSREQKLHRFLILGTASNPPTRIGMIEQIEWLKQIDEKLSFEVDIAGYGTETLKEHCTSSCFTLHGAVDSDKLNHLLSHAKAVLVHQKAGVGALTRIPEMLIAGVPVIANANTCRSAFSYHGVYCYDSIDELEALLAKELDNPNFLERPVAAEKRFIDCLKKLDQSAKV